MMKDPAVHAAATVTRVAANVRAALGWRGLKDQELAAPLGLSAAAVSRRLTGAVAFDIGELSVVSGLVGVSVGDLVDRDPWSPPEVIAEPI